MDKEKAIAKVKELRVLQPFLTDYRISFHIRQLAKILRMNHRTVSLTLESLEEKNVVSYKIEGRNKKYFLNLDNHLTKKYITNAEIAQTMIFIDKEFIIKKMLSELTPDIIKNTLIILFGSYVKNEKTKESDIDMVVMEGTKQLTEKLEEFYDRHNIEVHIHRISREAFLNGLKNKDCLMTEILKNHIILNNEDAFVDILWGYYNEIR